MGAGTKPGEAALLGCGVLLTVGSALRSGAGGKAMTVRVTKLKGASAAAAGSVPSARGAASSSQPCTSSTASVKASSTQGGMAGEGLGFTGGEST